MRKEQEQPDIFVGQLIYRYESSSKWRLKTRPIEDNAWGIIVSINENHRTCLVEELDTGSGRIVAFEMFCYPFMYLLPRELHDQLAEDEYE